MKSIEDVIEGYDAFESQQEKLYDYDSVRSIAKEFAEELIDEAVLIAKVSGDNALVTDIEAIKERL